MGEQSRVSPWAPVADLEAELETLQQKQADMKAELSQRRKTFVELQQKKRRVLETQIRRAKARITNAERKRRTHRLILLGTYLDHRMETDPTSKTRAMKGLDEFLERDRDRAVFDLCRPAPKTPKGPNPAP